MQNPRELRYGIDFDCSFLSSRVRCQWLHKFVLCLQGIHPSFPDSVIEKQAAACHTWLSHRARYSALLPSHLSERIISCLFRSVVIHCYAHCPLIQEIRLASSFVGSAAMLVLAVLLAFGSRVRKAIVWTRARRRRTIFRQRGGLHTAACIRNSVTQSTTQAFGVVSPAMIHTYAAI